MAEYTGAVTVRFQPEVVALADQAARRRGTKPSDYIRQAVLAALRADGIDPVAVTSRDAGALYDSVEGKRRYALIEGGKVARMSYHAERPSNGDWRPVVHRDSEPFNLATHWRLTPVAEVEDGQVVVTYPVVAREHA